MSVNHPDSGIGRRWKLPRVTDALAASDIEQTALHRNPLEQKPPVRLAAAEQEGPASSHLPLPPSTTRLE